MKLAKIKLVFVIILLISVVVFTISGIFYWKTHIAKTSIKGTNLNITNIIDSSLLKTVQYNVDYFFTTCGFAEIMSYEVMAGFKLKENDVDMIKMGEGQTKYIINLSGPTILNIDTFDKGLIIDNEQESNLAQAFRIFGQKHAKEIALRNGIFEKAEKRAKMIFKEFANKINTDIEINISPQQQNIKPKKKIFSKKHPLSLQINDDFICNSNPIDIFDFYCKDKNNPKNCVKALPVIKKTCLPEETRKKCRLFDKNQNVNIYFSKKEITQDRALVYFLFLIDNDLFKLSIESANFEELKSFFPRALSIVYSITKENTCDNCGKKTDFYGISIDQWSSSDISNLRDVIQRYITGIYELTSSNCNIKFIDFKFKNKVPILVDSDCWGNGYKYYIDDSRKFRKEILTDYEKIKSKMPPLDELIFILFDNNKAHRNRYVYFFRDRLACYTPERSLYLTKQNAVFTIVPYNEIFNTNDLSIENGEICFGESNECLDKDPFSDLILELRKHGFISLFQ